MRKYIAGITVFTIISILFACSNMFGEYTNPVDTGAENYQGYEIYDDPAQFCLCLPEDGYTSFWIPDNVTVSEIIGAEMYHVQVSATEDFSNILYDREQDIPVFDLSDMDLASDTYYWRGRVKDSSLYGNYSDTSTFTLEALNVTGMTPENGGSTFDTTPLLDWDDVEHAASYEVEVADTEAGLNGTGVEAVTASEYQVPIEDVFAFGDTCFWRVRIVNEDDQRSPWSGTYSVVIDDSITFSGVTPANGSSTFDTTPLLDWDDVEHAASYEVEVADTEAGLDGTGVEAVTASQYQVEETLSVGDTRYWRVRAVNEDDRKSAWSSVWSFEGAYGIGDTGPAGGIIFYDDEADGVDDIAGARYLECAPEATEWTSIEWGVYGTSISGADGTTVGTGEQNTQDIIASQGTGSTYAAQLCDGLEYGGYTDWFLPSKDELDLMYENLHQAGLGGFAGDIYWSSSEGSASYAWSQNFYSGDQSNYSKNFNYRVRAVRAF